MTETGFGPHEFRTHMIGHSSGFESINPLTYGPIFGPLNDLFKGNPINLTEGFKDVSQSFSGRGRSYESAPVEGMYNVNRYTITEFGARESYRSTSIMVNRKGEIIETAYERYNAEKEESVRYENMSIEAAFGKNDDPAFFPKTLSNFLDEFEGATGEKIEVTGFRRCIDSPVLELIDFVREEPLQAAPQKAAVPLPGFIKN